MPRSPDPFKSVRDAMRRLEASETKLTRRNARKALKQALDRIWSDADHRYPPLRADGSEIPRKKPTKGAYCHICKVPLKTSRSLLPHIFKHHPHLVSQIRRPSGKGYFFDCACGYRGTRDGILRHWGAQKSLAAHFAESQLLDMVQKRGSK